MNASLLRPISPRLHACFAALRTLHRDESGAMMIEISVGFMTMMMMLFLIMEMSMMGYTYSLLNDAAKDGVRYACVHGTDSSTCQGPSTGCDSTAANVVSDVKNYAKNMSANVTGMSVVATYPDGTSTGTSRVTVTVTYTYQSMFHIPGTTRSFVTSSTGRIMY